jgi:hypothetical protein
MSAVEFPSVSPVLSNVHELRRTPNGIKFLQATGQFKEYLQSRVDSKHRPFIAWDGEGWTDDNMEHHYMLFGSSTGDYIEAPHLSSIECIELLLRVASENPKTIHVIFGGGYDATHILRDLPLDLTAGLKDGNKIAWEVPAMFGQRRNRITIEYIPHKWLTLRGYDWENRRWSYVKIYDIMTFFQSSFINALESRKLEIPDVIKSGKASRSDFTYDDMDEIITYWRMELELTVELANTLRDELEEADLYVTQFHGPGAVANAMFKKHRIQDHLGAPPRTFMERAAQHAYFGGRFEQYKAGHYPGKVYLYDINSAYPTALTTLPSLAAGEWEYTSAFEPGSYGVWLCDWESLTQNPLSPQPAPWRGKAGVVGFPTNNTEVWLWTPEAKNVNVQYGYVWRPLKSVRPFAFMSEMYDLRLEWKNQGRGAERALKLGLNSGYGKLAQRIGGKPERNNGRPTWHRLEWAGMITSFTRAMIWDAVSQNPDAIISVETDSVCSTVPLDLDIGEGLGQWGLKEYDWITYVQSGIYFTPDGLGSSKSKTRGINAKELDHDAIMRWLADNARDPYLVSSRTFIGLGNPRTYLYGQWQDSTKEVKVAGEKRIHAPHNCAACQAGMSLADGLHDLIANPLYGRTPSAPHPLPWVEGGVIADTADIMYAGDAVAEWERRHV